MHGRWADYRQAVVDIRVGERNTVRVTPCAAGVTEGAFPEPSGRTVHIITAANPRGRVVAPEDNTWAHALLLDELACGGHTWWPATGGSPCGTHTEESVAVTGLTDAEARALGRRFGQDAVFAWSREAWRLLACFGERSAVAGWRTVPAPPCPTRRSRRPCAPTLPRPPRPAPPCPTTTPLSDSPPDATASTC
ncbi:DUF3293 domain-containing protein [Streptomyces sp. NPDC005435]|uniref:DUF3293 domain-containing protein n=1 Tax=Streptomyces sp. NPDC005435 TaxID=3154464 RepID=UPI003451FBF4